MFGFGTKKKLREKERELESTKLMLSEEQRKRIRDREKVNEEFKRIVRDFSEIKQLMSDYSSSLVELSNRVSKIDKMIEDLEADLKNL